MSGEGKLVRGRVPERVEERGTQPYFRAVRDREEHLRLTRQKLIDEAGEAVLAGPDSVLEEVADTIEAAATLAFLYGFTVRDLLVELRRKRALVGDFMAGLVLSWRDTCQHDK